MRSAVLFMVVLCVSCEGPSFHVVDAPVEEGVIALCVDEPAEVELEFNGACGGSCPMPFEVSRVGPPFSQTNGLGDHIEIVIGDFSEEAGTRTVTLTPKAAGVY